MSIREIEYGVANLVDFRVAQLNEKGQVKAMEVGGQQVMPTGRFWTSLCSNFSNYGLSMKLFRLYDHAEVFERLRDHLGAGKDQLRYAIDKNKGELLAVSNPAKPYVSMSVAEQTLQKYEASKVGFSDGAVVSTHTPAHMDSFDVGPDTFDYQYVMETPIDGFGSPLIYLSLLRQVCSNGSVGYARAFRSEITIGRSNDNPGFTLERALDSFSNEEGYAALRKRIEAATESWASIAETQIVYKALQDIASAGNFVGKDESLIESPLVDSLSYRQAAALGFEISDEMQKKVPPAGIKVMRAFRQLVGDLAHIYDLVSLDMVSAKRQAQLAARCSVYELFNFITEVATHYCNIDGNRKLQSVVGSWVSQEYDLEGTKQAKANFTDWFTDPSDVPSDE